MVNRIVLYGILLFSCLGCKREVNSIDLKADSINGVYKKVDSIEDYSNSQSLEFGEGIVRNEETAVKIAEAVLFPIYSEEVIINEKPYQISLRDNKVWCIEGYLAPDYEGGVFYIEIDKSNGAIIKYLHTK